jgi:hypothetical protein
MLEAIAYNLLAILATLILAFGIYRLLSPENRYISRDAYERKKLKKLKKEI